MGGSKKHAERMSLELSAAQAEAESTATSQAVRDLDMRRTLLEIQHWVGTVEEHMVEHRTTLAAIVRREVQAGLVVERASYVSHLHNVRVEMQVVSEQQSRLRDALLQAATELSQVAGRIPS